MTNASIKLYHGLLVRLFAGMPYSPGQLVCANGFSSVSAVAASLTIGIRRKYRDFGLLSLHRIDERRHLGEEGIIVVKLVNLFHIGPRSTDIQGGSVVRVDQFELIPIGDCKISFDWHIDSQMVNSVENSVPCRATPCSRWPIAPLSYFHVAEVNRGIRSFSGIKSSCTFN